MGTPDRLNGWRQVFLPGPSRNGQQRTSPEPPPPPADLPALSFDTLRNRLRRGWDPIDARLVPQGFVVHERLRREGTILQILLERDHPLRKERIAELAGLSVHQTRRVLDRLRAEGLVDRDGVSGPTVRWVVTVGRDRQAGSPGVGRLL